MKKVNDYWYTGIDLEGFTFREGAIITVNTATDEVLEAHGEVFAIDDNGDIAIDWENELPKYRPCHVKRIDVKLVEIEVDSIGPVDK